MISLNKIRNSVFYRGGLFSLFSFANKGIGFVLLVVLAKFLLPSDYGCLTLFNIFISVSSILICLSTDNYISVVYFQNNIDKFKKNIANVIILTLLIYVVLVALLLIFKSFFERIIGLPIAYQVIGTTISACQIPFNLQLNIYRLKEKIINYGIYSVLFALINAILAVLLIALFKMGWHGRALSQLFIIFVFMSISVCLLKKNDLVGNVDRVLMKEMLFWSLPLIPHLLSSFLRQSLDCYIVNFNYNTTMVGLYSFALAITNVVVIIGSAFNATNSVYVFKILKGGLTLGSLSLIKRNNKVMGCFFLFVTILILILFNFIVINFFPKYSGSIIYSVPLCIAAFFQAVYFLFANIFFFYKKTFILMLITLSFSLFHMLFSLFLTKKSILFTAYILMASSTFITVFAYFISEKIVNKELHEKNS